MKKSQSVQLDNDKKSVQREAENSSQAHSSISLQNNKSKLRVPALLQSTLRQQVQESGHRRPRKAEEAPGNSKISGMMKSQVMSTIHKLKDISACLICDGQIRHGKKKNRDVYMCECEHRHSFCESCLHHYVIYKVNNFEEVNCPQQDCPALLDIKAPFFKNLPMDIQKKYRKIKQFQEAAKDPKAKLCPQQNCEGIIRLTMDNYMICDRCEKEFCGKCLLKVHMGECDKQEILFFENNLHYRQCKKCSFVIEKNQGCNHMTCRCKYQFCYVCGAPWTAAHYGNHDQNGQLLAVPQPGAANRQREGRPALICCHYEDGQCQCDIECDCCECNCCECELDCQCCDCDLDDCCCGSALKGILKVFLLILFVPLALFLFIFRDLFFYAAMFLLALFAGMFVISFQILSEQEGFLWILGIFFFPVMMILGVGKSFQQFFCESAGQMWDSYWETVGDATTELCDI